MIKRRCMVSLFFAVVFFLWGGLYRWNVKGSPLPGVLEMPDMNLDLGSDAAQAISEYRQARKMLSERLGQMTPEERQLFEEAEAVHMSAIIRTNPLISRMAALRGTRLGPPPDPEELMRSIARAWWWSAEIIDILIWALFVALCVATIFAASTARRAQLTQLGRVALRVPEYWLRFVYAVCIILYGFTLSSPWEQMPISFFLVPALCLLVGFMLSVGHEEFGKIVKRAILAWIVPLSGYAFTFAVGLLLERFAKPPAILL